jgi:PncC family amidohydrolase
VSGELLDRFGLISLQTAEAMAQAARSQFGADFGVATTGVAGREAVEGKAPGTVFLAVDGPGGSSVREIHRPGDRETVKQFAAQTALDLLRRVLLDGKGGE